MKRSMISFFPIMLLCLMLNASAQIDLDALYRSHNFFELRDETKKITDDKYPKILFYRGAVANKFNSPLDSIAFLQRYLKTAKKPVEAKTIAEAYGILADDYIKTYQYARAAKVLKLLSSDFKNVLEADEIKDDDNDYKLYIALAQIPPQTISFDGDTEIQATRDGAKLLNLPIEANNKKMNFVFDTGANLSTMTVSTAKKLNLKIIEADFDVGSMTKERVKSKLAVVPTLKIGKITIHNAVFLVFEDAALFFPKINYQIEGIIGFPIIEAMRRITLSSSDLMTISAQTQKTTAIQNLALDGLSPVVQAVYKNRKMIFVIDTGAQTSTFHPPFFEAEKAEIMKTYQSQRSGVGGAGGSQQVDSYVLKDIALDIGGKTAHFPKINLITEIINSETRDYYGNLGQDLIKQFNQMTLDFQAMNLTFE